LRFPADFLYEWRIMTRAHTILSGFRGLKSLKQSHARLLLLRLTRP
jgi:hypothetical protein